MSLSPIVVRDLGVGFVDGTVLSGIDLVAQPGRRIGLVGENGVGKSTLLRAIAGALPARAQLSGTIQAPEDLVMLGQEPPFDDADTIASVLDRTLHPLRTAVADVERWAAAVTHPQSEEDAEARYTAALEYAVLHDAWDADRRAQVAATELGLDALDPNRLVGTLSGGQRTRLALAALMTTRPTALLLDEPTNHLDDEAIAVLTRFLVDLPGVVLLASHDRVLLDDVCTDLIDLDPSAFGTDGEGGRRFGGGWTAYSEHKAAARRRWEETYLEQQEELDRLRAATRIGAGAIAHNRGPRDNDKYIYKFKGAGVDRTLARRRRDAERRLAEAEETQVRKPPKPLELSSPMTGTGRAGRLAIVRDLVVDGRLRLPSFDVDAGEHVLVSGANGSGKSTLLGVLGGLLSPTSGTVQVMASRLAVLPQDVVFDDPRHTPEQIFTEAYADRASHDVPSLRDSGLIHPRDLRKPVALLSVGQRRRLGLALAIAAAPDLLLLDEPTNHISLALAGELEDAIGESAGTVVVATHDRWLRSRWAGREVRLTGRLS